MRPAEARTANRALCVSIHDVAPSTWPQCAQLLHALRAVADVPVSLLVVPAYHHLPAPADARYERLLEARLAHGDELVLHGYHHLDEAAPPTGRVDRFIRRTYTRGEGEFFAISQADARMRLERGLAWFAARGWPVHGFVAPAWLLGTAAWQALLEFPFEYTTTMRRFYLLPERTALDSRSLVYSVGSGWRRQMSMRWAGLLRRSLARQPLVRLSLHPVDAAHPQVVRHCQTLLASLLEDRAPMTKMQFARELRHAGTRLTRCRPDRSGEARTDCRRHGG